MLQNGNILPCQCICPEVAGWGGGGGDEGVETSDFANLYKLAEYLINQIQIVRLLQLLTLGPGYYSSWDNALY